MAEEPLKLTLVRVSRGTQGFCEKGGFSIVFPHSIGNQPLSSKEDMIKTCLLVNNDYAENSKRPNVMIELEKTT